MIYTITNNNGFPIAFYSSEYNDNIPPEAMQIAPADWELCVTNPGRYKFINNVLIEIGTTLDELKTEKFQDLDEIVLEKLNTSFKVGSTNVPINDETMNFLLFAKIYLELNPNTTLYKKRFGLITPQSIVGYINAIGLIQQHLYAKEYQLYNMIKSAQSKEELDNIDLMGGW
jgi:hypothetical protein